MAWGCIGINMNYVKVVCKLVLKRDGLAKIPLDELGNIKRFIFRCDYTDLLDKVQGRSAKDMDQEDLLCWFSDYFYFLDFLVSLNFCDEVLLAAIYFELEDTVYDYSFFSESLCDSYWIDSPKQKLAEDFAREEAYGYQYDEYVKRFGKDESNYTYR